MFFLAKATNINILIWNCMYEPTQSDKIDDDCDFLFEVILNQCYIVIFTNFTFLAIFLQTVARETVTL